MRTQFLKNAINVIRIFVTKSVKIKYVYRQKSPRFLSFGKQNKNCLTCAEIHEEACEAYRMKIITICAEYTITPAHIYTHTLINCYIRT